MDDPICRTDDNHIVPVQGSPAVLIFADSIHNLFPQRPDIPGRDGMGIGVTASGDCIHHHAVVLGLWIVKAVPYPLHRGSGSLNGGRGPSIQ